MASKVINLDPSINAEISDTEVSSISHNDHYFL